MFSFTSAHTNYIDDLLVNCKFSVFIFRREMTIDRLSGAGQNLYYGSHYPLLKSLKDQYDPLDTFKFPKSSEEEIRIFILQFSDTEHSI